MSASKLSLSTSFVFELDLCEQLHVFSEVKERCELCLVPRGRVSFKEGRSFGRSGKAETQWPSTVLSASSSSSLVAGLIELAALDDERVVVCLMSSPTPSNVCRSAFMSATCDTLEFAEAESCAFFLWRSAMSF